MDAKGIDLKLNKGQEECHGNYDFKRTKRVVQPPTFDGKTSATKTNCWRTKEKAAALRGKAVL